MLAHQQNLECLNLMNNEMTPENQDSIKSNAPANNDDISEQLSDADLEEVSGGGRNNIPKGGGGGRNNPPKRRRR
jgi:hypothetical protein